MDFPVYRKYANEQTFFVIHSLEQWTEYKRLGKKIKQHDFTAIQFPEKIFIQDLIDLQEGILPSSKSEIERLMQHT